jgi:hypothetical protein
MTERRTQQCKASLLLICNVGRTVSAPPESSADVDSLLSPRYSEVVRRSKASFIQCCEDQSRSACSSGSLLLLHTIQCHGTSSRKWLVVTGIGTVAAVEAESSRKYRRFESTSDEAKIDSLNPHPSRKLHWPVPRGTITFTAVKCPTNSKETPGKAPA